MGDCEFLSPRKESWIRYSILVGREDIYSDGEQGNIFHIKNVHIFLKGHWNVDSRQIKLLNGRKLMHVSYVLSAFVKGPYNTALFLPVIVSNYFIS